MRKRVILYFGDVFWCTVPYSGLSLFHELSKDFEVFPVFQSNDIRLYKEWDGSEKYHFNKDFFSEIDPIETSNLVETYKKLGADLTITPCQMQFKNQFASRNRALRSEGCKIGLWDVGGSDGLWCPSGKTGWEIFFSKGQAWKDKMVDSSSLKALPHVMSEDDSKIFLTGCLDYDEMFDDYNFKLRVPVLTKREFCDKYGLDVNRPIIAYAPANPRPDQNYRYPDGTSARQALTNINDTLFDLSSNEGYQVCFKTHPGDYMDGNPSDSTKYNGVHPRARMGSYKGPRYLCDGFDKFTTISAEDGYNLYRLCDFGVTNYSHVGYEFFLLKKPIISYGMKYTNEWQFVDNLCENVYTDIFSKEELKTLILDGGFNINFKDEYANKFFVQRSGSAYKKIAKSIRSYNL